MNKKNLTSFAVVAVFLLVLVFLTATQSTNREREVGDLAPKLEYSDIKYVKIAGVVVEVELALTSEEMSRGLSGRDTLPENTGMLFVFDQLGKYSFWMKDMNFPIDIIWLTDDLHVIYIERNARPESFPETFGPDAEAKYILEVMAGFAEKYNLKEGDKVEFLYQE
ncbi:MAG: DUF192 domain-containing protein [Candidatus Paceibacterota bacterium]